MWREEQVKTSPLSRKLWSSSMEVCSWRTRPCVTSGLTSIATILQVLSSSRVPQVTSLTLWFSLPLLKRLLLGQTSLKNLRIAVRDSRESLSSYQTFPSQEYRMLLKSPICSLRVHSKSPQPRRLLLRQLRFQKSLRALSPLSRALLMLTTSSRSKTIF